MTLPPCCYRVSTPSVCDRAWPQKWRPLPGLFSEELGLPDRGSHREKLVRLGRAHRQLSGAVVNWTGTYENVAHHLIRRWELEHRWNR